VVGEKLKRLQQYQIFKINSSRLKKNNYSLNLSVTQGRKNGEVVSIGDSQMLRSLRFLKNQTNNEEEIHDLMIQRKKIKHKLSTQENIGLLLEIEKQIDDLIFVPEIISIFFEKNTHYEYIGKNGFYINGIRFVRLLCSSGNARRNTAIFVSDQYEKSLKEILNNNRKDIEIIPNKFSAYFSLCSSNSIAVSTPYFCVVPDCEVTRIEKVEFITEDLSGEDKIEIVEKEIIFNLWDGQGLISPRFAKQLAEELDLDYIPSTFVIRSNFIKGMLCVFDFHEFSDECGKHFVKDAWGNNYNIRDADIIITTSQFKLWSAWDNLSSYTKSCEKNQITWNISKWSPKYEKTHTNLNYQFLQALDLDGQQIEKLCQKTLDYISGIINNYDQFALLYLLGDLINNPQEDIFSKIGDNITKAIILNNNLIHDPYIKNHIIHSLNKKIKESYIGDIIVEGFYTTMINDPYAFCEYIFEFPIKGLLARDEHYNKTWLDKNETQIASLRAPLTWKSEVNILNLKTNKEIERWYKYINIGAIFNIHGCDHMLEGGSDVDGDLTCLTNQKEIIEGASRGLPIYYETRKAEKKKILEEELYKYDIKGFNTKVGFLTNISTTMYAMLPSYKKDSQEYKTITNRLKQCRKEQGAIIDSQKGLEIRPIPAHWTNWIKTDTLELEEKEKAEFYNSILIDKRPYFFRYLYPDYNKKFINYNNFYENYCITNLGKYLWEVLEAPVSDKEFEIKNKYLKYNPLIDTDCLMNNLCHYLEKNIKEIKIEINVKPTEQNVRILKNIYISVDKDKLKSLYDLYKIYKSEKRNFGSIKNSNGEELYKTLEQYNKHIRQKAFEISSDIQELANLAIVICYEVHPSDSKSFAWNIFGEGIVKNVEMNRQENLYIPFLDKDGSIEYLGKRYSNHHVELYKIEEDYDNF
jgi:hypothetical protein